MKSKTPSIRTCVGCFQKFLQAELIGITRLPTGEIKVEKNPAIPKNPGRSVYLCSNLGCLERAMNRKGKNALSYGLKVPVNPDIVEHLTALICSIQSSKRP